MGAAIRIRAGTVARADQAQGWSVPTLLALTVMFACRVVAQLVQAFGSVERLPPFEAWQSGAIPYPLLLTAQILILTVQVWLVGRIRADRFRPRPSTRRALVVVGLGYGGFMAGRLGLGLTVLDGHPWFDAPLPSLFHLLLAAFLITTATGGRNPESAS